MEPAVVDDEVTLRPASAADAPEVFALVDAARRRVGRFHPWWAELATIDDAARWCERGWPDRESLLVADHGRIVGVCSLGYGADQPAVELSYWIARQPDSPGLAERACARLVALHFDGADPRALQFACADDHAEALALAAALGFTAAGRRSEPAMFVPGGFRTTITHVLTRARWTEWRAR